MLNYMKRPQILSDHQLVYVLGIPIKGQKETVFKFLNEKDRREKISVASFLSLSNEKGEKPNR